MARFVALLALVAIVLGIAGLAGTTESASAQLPDAKSRFDLRCNQIMAPNNPENPFPGVGLVRCVVTVDIPDSLTPPLPDTISLTVYGVYKDVDENNRPSLGDRLLCVRVIGPGGNVLFERCRPGVPYPPPLSPPDELP